MFCISTNLQTKKIDIKHAILSGLAPDGGLYIPETIPTSNFISEVKNMSFQEIALKISELFLAEEIPADKLKNIVYDAINFPAPLKKLHDNLYSLELFYGPTLAFKDFGARFMARVMSYFLTNHLINIDKLTILVATSGDTGSAVAQGFLNVPNIDVVILYPSKRVSFIQEKQLTTMGCNINALEVDGTFDDCQKLVKQAFVDLELQTKCHLGSANSINLARLIPQIFYYFNIYKELKSEFIVSIPSGNLGNLTAAVFAKVMGLPIRKIIVATNINDVFPQYLKTGNFNPHTSYQTISNAMDVGNPSNFARLKYIFKNNLAKMQELLIGMSFDDSATKLAVSEVYHKYSYILDPHGAVGYLALKQYLSQYPNDCYLPSVVVETAHPAKFLDIINPLVDNSIEIPDRLKMCLTREKEATFLVNDYTALKTFLLNNCVN